MENHVFCELGDRNLDHVYSERKSLLKAVVLKLYRFDEEALLKDVAEILKIRPPERKPTEFYRWDEETKEFIALTAERSDKVM